MAPHRQGNVPGKLERAICPPADHNYPAPCMRLPTPKALLGADWIELGGGPWRLCREEKEWGGRGGGGAGSTR